MRSSLWVRLVGAFLVIIITGAVATYAVVNLVTASQFRRFVLTEDIFQAQALTTPLASYFLRQGSWQGVEDLLASSQPAPGMTLAPALRSGASAGVGMGMMRGSMMRGRTAEEMQAAMQDWMQSPDRIVLLDRDGLVVADTRGLLLGEDHGDAQLAQGVPVMIDGQPVGTVLVGSMIEPTLDPLAEDFLASVNLSVLIMALLGALAALALGLLLFRQIIAPLDKVTAAAEALASGDLSQRVAEEGAEELRQLAQAFNHMAVNLAQAEQLRRNLIADVAHELRTPIFVMQGNLEAMLDGVFDLNPENVAAVHHEALLLGRLVGDLRDLASAEAGELRLERVACDVKRLIRQVVERMQREAGEKSIVLSLDLAPPLPDVLADPQRIEQVLVNLVSNALRHTPAGGRVSVQSSVVSHQLSVIGKQSSVISAASGTRHGPATDHQLSITDHRSLTTDHWLLITVMDNGEGIAPADLPFVFERLYRADKSRSRATGGSGLGLTIARQIVEAHGGEIWAESAGPGQGSAFFFTLPLA